MAPAASQVSLVRPEGGELVLQDMMGGLQRGICMTILACAAACAVGAARRAAAVGQRPS